MKARIEDGDLRNFRTKYFPGRLNAFQIDRVMQGSKGGQTLDDRFDLGIHHDSLVKFSAAVDDAMSDDVDFGRPLQD